MTRKEMTEIFTIMSLAWPNAEMFKGGVEKLAPTITLWATCLPDVDMWTAQQAVVKLCQECKFPPTIAEFRERVEAVNAEVRRFLHDARNDVWLGATCGGSLEAYLHSLPEGSKIKAVVLAMGGVEAAVSCGQMNWDAFDRTYEAMLRKETALAGGARPALGNGQRKERK